MPISKRKVGGSLLVFIGYLLSPLSWWNDLFVNFPLAIAFAWGVSAIYKPLFAPALVVGYWLTNVLGFVLMHKGAQQFFSQIGKKYTRRELLKDLIISLLYTGLMVLLLRLHVLKPITSCFEGR